MALGPAITQTEIPGDNTPQGGAGPNDVTSKRPGLMSQWNDWLSKPENSSALLQFGINAMQPYGEGQTAGGHLAQSIGAGMEARDRVIGNEQEQTQQATVNARADAESGRQDAALGISKQRLALDTENAASERDLRSANADYYRSGGRGTGKRTPAQEASDLLNTASKAYKAVSDDIDADPETLADARTALDFAYKRFNEISGGATAAPAATSNAITPKITGNAQADGIIADARARIAALRQQDPASIPARKQAVIQLIRKSVPNYNGEGLE